METTKYFLTLTFITLVTTILLVRCSTISVMQDYDPEYDFSKLKTFGFLPIPEDAGIDQLNANRFGDAIKNEMTAKGYTVSEKADFGVAILFGKQTKTNITSYGYGYGPYWGRYGGTTNIDVSQYDEGTLVIDVIDMTKKELVWRGTGTGALTPNATVEERTANINNAVAQILAQFPPTPVQK
jgi:Domain of unknown function (DUF4136)